MTRAEPIPRNKENDYAPEEAARRREFLKQKTGASLDLDQGELTICQRRRTIPVIPISRRVSQAFPWVW